MVRGSGKRGKVDERGCYVCGLPKVSVEHAPQEGLYPNAFHPSGVSYRQGIVQVPACAEHNEAFSKDDEYFIFVASRYVWSNSEGKHQMATKVARAFARLPHLEAGLFPNPQPIPGHPEWSAADADQPRLHRVLRKITAALYFEITGSRLPQECWPQISVIIQSLVSARTGQPLWDPRIGEGLEEIPFKEIRSGHPSVFRCLYYIDPDTFTFCYFFYDHFKAMVVWSKDHAGVLAGTSSAPPPPAASSPPPS